MNLFAALSSIGRTIWRRAYFQYGTLVSLVQQGEALLPQVQNMASDAASHLQQLSDSQVRKQLEDLLKTCKSVQEIEDKLNNIKGSLEVDSANSLAIDAILVVMNIIALINTHVLLLDSARKNEEVVRYLQQKDQMFNLLFDKVEHWQTITDLERLNAKNIMQAEVIDLLRIQRALTEDQHMLEKNRIYKYLWLLGGGFAILSGVFSYKALWASMTPGAKAGAWLLGTGLTATTMFQAVQLHLLNNSIDALIETQQIMMWYQEKLNVQDRGKQS